MSRTALALLTLVLLAALLVLLWWPGGGGPEADGETRAPGAASVEPAVVDHAGLEHGGAGSGRSEVEAPAVEHPVEAAGTPEDPVFGWRGRVVDASGAPVVDAVVHAFSYPVSAEVLTDSRGTFLLPWEAVYPWDRVSRVFAAAGGRAGEAVTGVAPAAPPAEVEIRLGGSYPVNVETRHYETQAPIAGVEVWLNSGASSAYATTDATGRATLFATQTGEVRLGMTWRGTGSSSVSEELLLAEHDEPPLVVFEVVPFAQRLRLAAVDAASGLAVPEARFQIVPEDRRFAEDGGFASVELPAPDGVLDYAVPEALRPLVVLVDAPGYLGVQTFVATDTAEVLTVPLERAPATPFRVTVGGQAPAGPCTLHWRWDVGELTLPADLPVETSNGFSPEPLARGSETTDDQGRGIVPFAAEGEGFPPMPWIVVEGPGGLRRDFGRLHVRKMGEPPWIFELETARAQVAFRAVDDTGAPLAGVSVDLRARPSRAGDPGTRAFYDHRQEARYGLAAQGKTDANGVFVATLLAETRLQWQAGYGQERHAGSESELLLAGEVREIEQAFTRSGLAISGRVTLADGSPPGGFLGLHFELDGDVGGFRTRTSSLEEDGSFRFTDVPAGEYELILDGGPELETRVVRAGDEDLEFRLPPLASLRLRVVDADHRELLDDVLFELRSPSYWMATRRNGEMIVEHFARHYDLVLVSRDQYETQLVDLRAYSDAALRDLEIALAPGRQITLSFVGSDGSALDPGFDIRWAPAGSGLPVTAIGDWISEDTWTWPSAPHGAGTLHVQEDGIDAVPPISLPSNGDPWEHTVVVPVD